MESILMILPILVLLVLLWFSFLNISFLVTILRARKKDRTLELCLSPSGKYFYIALILIYSIAYISAIVYMVIALFNASMNSMYLVLNIITVCSIGFVYLIQQIIFVGQRQLLIGRIRLDYRKIKRVTFPKSTKLSFVYGQKSYQTSLWFIDDFKLKKALQKSR